MLTTALTTLTERLCVRLRKEHARFMAGEDVDIPFETMQELADALKAIDEEFADAGARTRELVEAIDRPQGDSELQDAAEDFESRWDDKRETLRRKIEEFRKRVEDTKHAWEDLDVELAQMQESSE